MYTVRGLGGKVRKEAAHREGSFQRDVRFARARRASAHRKNFAHHLEKPI